MDLSITKFNLRVESFVVSGVKNAPTDSDVSLALVLNLDGQGFAQPYTYDSSNRSMTTCACTATGTQQALCLAESWDIPVHTLPGTMLRVFLSEVGTPRVQQLEALTASYEWLAVLALTPVCDQEDH
jgi:hypothetical protein